jgi:hypothetical protein
MSRSRRPLALVALGLLWLARSAAAFELNGVDWTYKPSPMGESWTVCATGMPAGAPARTRDGAFAWNYPGFAFAFGTDACSSGGAYPSQNNVNQVDFGGGLGSSVLAETTYFYIVDTGDIVECDMRFNSMFSWYTGTGTPPGTQFDWWSVAAHEMGHCLSLNHEDGVVPTPIMGSFFAPGEVRRTLTADDAAGRNAIYGGGGGADTTKPAAVLDLAATDRTATSVTLSWTAPGDDGHTGTAARYDIRRATSGPITEATWAAAIPLTGEPAPLPANTPQAFAVTGLGCGTLHYFALKTSDEAFNTSAISNSPGQSTLACVAPSNDDFVNAQLLSGAAGRVTGTTEGATRQAGEPGHAGQAGGASVWYRWTPPATGTAAIDTIGSGFDTLLAVYTGSNVAALTAVASNDDFAGPGASRVTFPAVAGATYRIAVDGYAGAAGSVVLNWSLLRPLSDTRIVTGPGQGGTPLVRGFAADGVPTEATFLAQDPAFRGGVRVALGDVTGDGVADIVTGSGPGAEARVRVFDGATLAERVSFVPYPGFPGGVYVATGDVDGDGFADVITGVGDTGAPHVQVFDGGELAAGRVRVLASFFPYNPGFRGGVLVAAGDFDGDGRADVVTGTGVGGGPHVEVFDGAELVAGRTTLLASFFAYDPGFRGGVFVAAGDLDGDGRADLITGTGVGGGPHVAVFDGAELLAGRISYLASYFAYDPGFRGGVQVSAADISGDGRADLITGTGVGGGPHVQVVDGAQLLLGRLQLIAGFFAYDPAFLGGVFVSGAP